MSGALLPVRLQQQSRARSPFKCTRKGDWNPARGGQGSLLQPFPGGSGSGLGAGSPPHIARHKGLRVLFSRGAPGNSLCIQEVSVPFLSLPCHNNEHFLRRKGDHRAEELGGGGESLGAAGAGE